MSIDSIKKEYNEILQKLSNSEIISNWDKFEKINKRRGTLEKIIEKDKEINEIKNKIDENMVIISAGEDSELISMAESEISQLREKEKNLFKELEDLLNSKNTAAPESQPVIIEIRAGTGGKEATLFAADLFKAYSKYAQKENWRQKTLNSQSSELGGLKEIIFELRDGDIFSKMKYEGGVHRVQRIPVTEKSGRIHTSTVSVAILPKPKKTELKIKPDDLRVDLYRSSGPGGQNVNRRETAVRITHLPTGIVVASQTERNQLQNRENAMAILEAKILDQKEMKEIEKLDEKRKVQIKWAKRAEKIRTYNFPQDRVTDHRIKKSFHNINKIMEGELDPIIQNLKESEEKA